MHYVIFWGPEELRGTFGTADPDAAAGLITEPRFPLACDHRHCPPVLGEIFEIIPYDITTIQPPLRVLSAIVSLDRDTPPGKIRIRPLLTDGRVAGFRLDAH